MRTAAARASVPFAAAGPAGNARAGSRPRSVASAAACWRRSGNQGASAGVSSIRSTHDIERSFPLTALELGQTRIETRPRFGRVALERSLEGSARFLAHDAAARHDERLAQRRMQRPELRMARDGRAIGDDRSLELTVESIGLTEAQGRLRIVGGARLVLL